ncbi:SRPBCC domain-containing protein [Candidatus Gracilibacteria bacterium]|nr:SRPBCC domain-containing protein [Candidatus Gracilibacteria bacterium]
MSELLFEVTYPHPPEHVWRALTDAEALAAWLMPNDFQPVVGHHFTFQAPPQPGFDGIVRCEVLAVEPPRRLSYSWQGGPLKTPTTVSWTLAAIDEGTKLRLVHSGFAGIGGLIARLILGEGWRGLLKQDLPHALQVQAVIRPQETEAGARNKQRWRHWCILPSSVILR